MRLAVAAALLTMFASATASPAATEITVCGQIVSGHAFLTADLDCAPDAPFAIGMERNGTLELRGFTVSGGVRGVLCFRHCAITGPGRITAAVDSGVHADRRVVIREVVLDAHGQAGVLTNGEPGGKVLLVDSIVSGNGTDGISTRSAKIVRSSVTGNGRYGIHTLRQATLGDSTVTGNAAGDVFSVRKPKLVRSVCDISIGWDVCSSD